jgi:carbon starvation protein CstA
MFWVLIVFIYYILATLLPIDKIIGKIYPIFGFTLLFMAVGLLISMFINDYPIPELTFANNAIISITSLKNSLFFSNVIHHHCLRAISGFHSTQSPLMARCITNEKLSPAGILRP